MHSGITVQELAEKGDCELQRYTTILDQGVVDGSELILFWVPFGLQSLTFGHAFNQIIENVSLPSDLQSLAFGRRCNQNMEKVSLCV